MQRIHIIISGLVTAGVAVLSCSASPDFIRRFMPIPEFIFVIGIYIGAFLLVAALGLFLYEKLQVMTPEKDYIPRKITKHNLGELHEFLREFLGEEILSLERMKAFYEKNPDVFFGIYEEWPAFFGGRIKQLCGYYSIAPITAVTRDLLNRSALRGSDFGPENITAKRHRPAGLYIGGLAARGFKAKAATLQALLARLQVEAERKSPHVYTRPVSEDGLRLARRNHFHPVIPSIPNPLNVVHYRNFKDNDPE